FNTLKKRRNEPSFQADRISPFACGNVAWTRSSCSCVNFRLAAQSATGVNRPRIAHARRAVSPTGIAVLSPLWGGIQLAAPRRRAHDQTDLGIFNVADEIA